VTSVTEGNGSRYSCMFVIIILRLTVIEPEFYVEMVGARELDKF
jgi:hypothetical protein